MSRFDYRVHKLPRVLELLAARQDLPLNPGGFIASDQETDALEATLKEGYRWVRTEDGYAVFEKQLD